MTAAKVKGDSEATGGAGDDVGAYRLERAARYIDVSRDTLYQMVRAGEIPHTRVRSSIRIRRADLDAYLAQRVTSAWTRVDGRGRPSAAGGG